MGNQIIVLEELLRDDFKDFDIGNRLEVFNRSLSVSSENLPLLNKLTQFYFNNDIKEEKNRKKFLSLILITKDNLVEMEKEFKRKENISYEEFKNKNVKRIAKANMHIHYQKYTEEYKNLVEIIDLVIKNVERIIEKIALKKKILFWKYYA